MLRPLALVLLTVSLARAGEVQILAAEAIPTGDSWRFDVTLRHDDTGWEHYADAFRVVDTQANVYGTRTLFHPHVEEQPFTRSLTGVVLPPHLTSVRIEARDNRHGWAIESLEVVLPGR